MLSVQVRPEEMEKHPVTLPSMSTHSLICQKRKAAHREVRRFPSQTMLNHFLVHHHVHRWIHHRRRHHHRHHRHRRFVVRHPAGYRYPHPHHQVGEAAVWAKAAPG